MGAVEGKYGHNVGPSLRDPEQPSPSFWSHIYLYDLADALRLAAGSDLPGHKVMYIASPDNSANRPLAELLWAARRLLGYAPSRSWRDYLTEDGRLRLEPAARLERGETGVQRGRALAQEGRCRRVALPAERS